MTYHPTFDRSPQGKLADGQAFSQVVVGTEAYVLEDEFNEMQAIVQGRLRSLQDVQAFDRMTGGYGTYSIHGHYPYVNTVVFYPIRARVAGHEVYVYGMDNAGQAPQTTNGNNILHVGLPPESGTRQDLVILEVIEKEVSGTDTLHLYGTAQSRFTMPNNLVDERIGQETSRRLQVQNALRVLTGVVGVSGLDTAVDPLGGTYAYDRNGRWRSTNGYFAIPIAVLTRGQQTTLSASDVKFAQFDTNIVTDEDGVVRNLITMLGDKQVMTTGFGYDANGDLYSVDSIKDDQRLFVDFTYNDEGDIITVSQKFI